MWPKNKKVFQKRAKQAMEKLIKTTPILQTKIVAVKEQNESNTSETDQTSTGGESSSVLLEKPATTLTSTQPPPQTTYIYTKHESKNDWPIVQVHFGEYSNEEVTAMIFDLEAKELDRYGHGGSEVANNSALRFHLVRGKNRVVCLLVWPHSFMDGIGIGTVYGMWRVSW
jgi:hypothetical protein